MLKNIFKISLLFMFICCSNQNENLDQNINSNNINIDEDLDRSNDKEISKLGEDLLDKKEEKKNFEDVGVIKISKELDIIDDEEILELVKDLLNKKKDIKNLFDKKNIPILIRLIDLNLTNTFKLLTKDLDKEYLEKRFLSPYSLGATNTDKNAVAAEYIYLLSYCCYKGNLDLFRYLIEEKKLNMAFKSIEFHPLKAAVASYQEKIVEYLLLHFKMPEDIIVSATRFNFERPIEFKYIKELKNIEKILNKFYLLKIINKLDKNEINNEINGPNFPSSKTLICIAASNNNLDNVNKLLDLGSSVTYKIYGSEKMGSALMYAIESNNMPSFNLLLKNLKAEYINDRFILPYLYSGEVQKLILNNPLALNFYEFTHLEYAAYIGNIEAFKILIKNYKDIKLYDNYKRSILLYACIPVLEVGNYNIIAKNSFEKKKIVEYIINELFLKESKIQLEDIKLVIQDLTDCPSDSFVSENIKIDKEIKDLLQKTVDQLEN